MQSRIDPDVVKKMLLGAEKKINAHGWDQPCLLATINVIERDGEPVALGISPLPFEIENPPGVNIARMGRQMLIDGEIGKLMAENEPGFYGFAFIHEAWMLKANEEQRREHLRSNRSIADTPGGIEIRSIMAITIYGDILAVVRERGKTAEVWADDDANVGVVSGRMTTGLLAMVRSVVGYLPDNDEGLQGLAERRDLIMAEERATEAEMKADR